MALIKGKQILSLDASKINESEAKKFISQTEKDLYAAKAEVSVATESADGLMSVADKAKLNLVEAEANKYIHPVSHDASIITETGEKRFVSDIEKALYADKYTKAEVANMISGLEGGLEWKDSVATFADLATTYLTPALGWVASVDDEAGKVYRYNGSTWVESPIGAYVKATAELDGLMSSEDKAKLDLIAAGANNYVHPEFTAATEITEDATHRFTTDVEKASYAAKAEVTPATITVDGLMSATDKVKVNALYNTELSSVVITPANGQTVIATTIKTDGTTAVHTKDFAKVTVAVNGFLQANGLDFTVAENGSNLVEITWLGRHFALDNADELIVTFLQDK